VCGGVCRCVEVVMFKVCEYVHREVCSLNESMMENIIVMTRVGFGQIMASRSLRIELRLFSLPLRLVRKFSRTQL
jgi:hypothetical protein